MRFILVLIFGLIFIKSDNTSAKETTLSSFYEIAKETCKDISSVRVEIDRINSDILRLLTERTAYVKRIGDLKSHSTKIAHDPVRVAMQEKDLINKSIKLELPIEISIPVFRAIVENSTKFQQNYINRILSDNYTYERD